MRPPAVVRHYFFKCEECGQYAVDSATAHSFVPEELQRSVEEAWEKGAHAIVVTFKGKCPKCAPDDKFTTAEISVSAMYPKLQ